MTPARDAGGEAEGDRRDVAAGHRDPGGADEQLALLLRPAGEQQLRQAVGPGAV